ncbi:MAG: septal ring lytic transglycosylase RlpA family protein [Chloroflexota bacterium]
MRLPRVVAGLALIVGLALVVVPGRVGSRSPDRASPLDPASFGALEARSIPLAAVAATLDPAHRSKGALEPTATLLEPANAPEPVRRAVIAQPKAPTGVVVVRPKAAAAASGAPVATGAPVAASGWRRDPEVSWYGPGFYGNRTACGLAYTKTIMGVAHRTLPCGTMVSFRNPKNGRVITVPVIDRGPYVAGRHWDLSGAACTALAHCYTGPIDWRYP